MDFWHRTTNCLIDVKDTDGNVTGQVATLNCVPELVSRLLQVALIFGGTIAVFFIIWGGLKIIRSGGDAKQMEGARSTITYAIVGLIIVFMAYFIITFIADVTGVECIKTFGFNQCE